MQGFVAKLNVDRYRHLLETEQDPSRREQIEHLLAEALAELKAIDDQPPMATGPGQAAAGAPRLD